MAHETKTASKTNYFEQTDSSVYMLGLPTKRPRMGTWALVAILAGTLLAVAILLLESYAFNLS